MAVIQGIQKILNCHQDEVPIPANILQGLVMGHSFKARQAEDWQRLQKAFSSADDAFWRGDVEGLRGAFTEERIALSGFKFS